MEDIIQETAAAYAPAQPVSEEALRLARQAVKDFDVSCFWFWHPDAEVKNLADVRVVIDELRRSGGKKGWYRAAEIVKCL